MEPPATGLTKEERIRRAKQSLVISMPPRERYMGIPDDLIQGLQKRDTKWQTCISSTLISELGDALLPTVLLDLSFEEAQEMKLITKAADIPTRPVLQALMTRMEALWISQWPAKSDGLSPLFCKLSFMSPKDLVVHPSFPTSKAEFERRIRGLFDRASLLDRTVSIAKLIHHPTIAQLWLEALNNSLQVRTPLQVLTLLCSSSRCQEELNDALIHRNVFSLSIVLRPWVTIRPGFEFRIYVCEGAITCASQYEPVHHPEVWAARDTLPELLGNFVRQRVIPKLAHRLPSFVVDVVMLDGEHKGQLAVCELNPFAATSSACLFSWRDDLELLLLGPETWRFASPALLAKPHGGEAIPREWQDLAESILLEKRARLLSQMGIGGALLAAVAVGFWRTPRA